MSLIFEALKKLDREKQAPERGFLVVGASSWGAGRRLRPLPIALALIAAGVGGFLIAQWALRPRAARPVADAKSSAPEATVPSRPGPPPTYAAPSPSTYAAPVAPPARRTDAAQPVAPAPAPAASDARPAAPAITAPPATRPARAAAPPAEAPVVPVETTYTLHAVTSQDGQPIAIVNGQLVRVGDVVEGARVLRIEAEAVELEKDGRRIVIGF